MSNELAINSTLETKIICASCGLPIEQDVSVISDNIKISNEQQESVESNEPQILKQQEYNVNGQSHMVLCVACSLNHTCKPIFNSVITAIAKESFIAS